MEAHYSVTMTTPFVIGPDQLETLSSLLRDEIGKVEILAECSDGFSRQFSSFQELVNYENPRSKEITRIQLTARSDGFTKNASIDISGSRWRGVSLDFRANEDAVDRLRTHTLDVFDGTRPWYGMVHNVDFVYAGCVALLLLWLSLLAGFALRRVPGSDTPESTYTTKRQSAIAQMANIAVLAAIFGIGIVLNRARDTIFPRAVFTIGQGAIRFRDLERWHWGLLIATFASLIAGFLIIAWQARRGLPNRTT